MKEIKTQGVKICDADLENIWKIANRSGQVHWKLLSLIDKYSWDSDVFKYGHVSVPEVTSKAFLGPFIIQ